MTKSELAARVAKRTGLSEAEARRAVDGTLAAISDELANGRDVSLAGFGKFSVAHRAARAGRNPSTGENIAIAAAKTARFSAAASLKKALNAELTSSLGGGDSDEDY